MATMPAPRTAAAVFAVVACVLAGCGTDGHASPPAAASQWSTIAAVDGASLSRLSLGDGSHAYLQEIDLRRMRIEQVTGDRDTGTAAEPGRYFPASASPRYVRIPPGQARDACSAGGLFSIVNFAFFEEYDRSTRLSFPVKSHAALLSGGSSPYGPVPAPSDAYYRDVTLRALTWTDSDAAIGPYDPNRGAPLDAPGTPDGIVTYAYRDHPSYVLNHDPPNRYQLLALSDPQHLLVLTVEHATLAAAADLLRARNVVGDILTFDGGISTYLWQATLGELVHITNQDGALPHYVCVMQRPRPTD
jgi:hypothetical protein